MKIPILVSSKAIQERVGSLAGQISRDYRVKRPVIISILNGSFVFTADLIRRLRIPVECGFIRLSSYGRSTESSGKIKVIMDVDVSLKNRDVIILDDIIDTGLTISYLIKRLKKQKARSIKICALLDKPERRVANVKPDYCGFIIPNKFVAGYGIDYQEKFRQLKYIGYLSSQR